MHHANYNFEKKKKHTLRFITFAIFSFEKKSIVKEGFFNRMCGYHLKIFISFQFICHSGDILLWYGVRHHLSCINIFILRTYKPPPPSPTQGQNNGGGVKSVKLMFFSKRLILQSSSWIWQTRYIVIMTKAKEGLPKLNFMTPGAIKGSCFKAWSYRSYSKNALFENLLDYSEACIRRTRYIYSNDAR